MKKIIVSLLFASLITCGSLFAQSLIGSWQLQNLGEKPISQKFIITENLVEVQIKDLVTQEFQTARYKSRIDGNQIILFDSLGKASATTITWINKNKFKVVFDDGPAAYYGRCGTWSDRFMADYIASGIIKVLNEIPITPENNVPASTSAPTSTPQTDTVCRACLGTGQCPVCHGSRRVSYYGNSKPCTECTDGKCFHCHGTKKQ